MFQAATKNRRSRTSAPLKVVAGSRRREKISERIWQSLIEGLGGFLVRPAEERGPTTVQALGTLEALKSKTQVNSLSSVQILSPANSNSERSRCVKESRCL